MILKRFIPVLAVSLAVFIGAGSSVHAGKETHDISAAELVRDMDINTNRIIGYLPDWSYKAYTDIDFSRLTHIHIAFCNPDENGMLSCYIPDDEMKQIVSAAHQNNVEVFAALGGAGGCDNYLQYIDTAEEMTAFSENIIAYCEKYDLDGIDLDIELTGSHPIWDYYDGWCRVLRTLCDNKDMKMSTATAQWASERISPETFALFDFVSVMAYDNDVDKVSHASYEYAERCLDYFSSQKKIPNQKLVLGVPFYGRGYQADGSLDWNSYMSFSEIIDKDSNYYNYDNFNGIAYNGADTIMQKANLARDYGGIMIWELSQDAKGDFSLLKVIKETLDQNAERPRGDVNADGTFSVADVVLLQKWILAVPDTALDDWKAADLYEDDKLNVLDLCMMKRLLLDQQEPADTIG